MRRVCDIIVPCAFLLLAQLGTAQSAPPAAPPASATPASAKKPILPKPVGKVLTKPAAQKPSGPPKPPACAPGEGGVTLLQTESDIKCDEGFQNCAGELQVAARNCTSEFQSFSRIEVYEGARRTLVLEFSPASITSPGGVWREILPWSTPAELTVEVFYHPPGQTSEQSARGPLKIANQTLAAAQAACAQCQGVWGKYGMNKHEGCNCKMADAGKECHDGDECQGYCVFQRYDGEAREEGICSETKYLAGCYPVIFKGASQFPPSKPPPRKRTTCVD